MTAAARPIPIDRARRGAGPVLIEVGQNELMKTCMDAQALAWEAIRANGAALELVLRLPAGPMRSEMRNAHLYAHDQLKKLIKDLRMAAGRYESSPRRT